MRTGISRIAVMVALVAFLASSAIGSAQIDKRVNMGNDGGGRLHDANTQVGSGGINLARPSYDTGGRADAIITGNVTGLGRFQGYAPLLQNNSFRANLGTTTLSNFQRQSVGLSEALGSRAYTPGYFYDTQRTVGDVGTIRQSLNLPGSSALATPYVSPARAGGIGENPAALGISDPRDRRLATGVDPNLLGTYRVEGTASAFRYGPPILPTPAYDRAVGSSIFGPPVPNASTVLDTLAERRAARRELVDRLANDLQRERLKDELARRDQGLPPAPRAPAAVAPEEIPPSIASIEVVGAAKPQGQREPAGADAFADMVQALKNAQAGGKPAVGFGAPERLAAAAETKGSLLETKSPESRIGTKREPGHRADELRGAPATGRPATPGTWGVRSVDDPVRTFTGAYADRLNECMANGEEQLHEGRFYHAARQFELASVIAPNNPLPLLARGHALAAAGDYVSAVRSLVDGIERFPQMAAFKLDLNSLVGQTDVFDRRRADLERRLADHDDVELRFLLGYLELYSGLTDTAQKNLQAAAAKAPAGSVISRFPDLIFGRAALPPAPKFTP